MHKHDLNLKFLKLFVVLHDKQETLLEELQVKQVG